MFCVGPVVVSGRGEGSVSSIYSSGRYVLVCSSYI